MTESIQGFPKRYLTDHLIMVVDAEDLDTLNYYGLEGTLRGIYLKNGEGTEVCAVDQKNNLSSRGRVELDELLNELEPEQIRWVNENYKAELKAICQLG